MLRNRAATGLICCAVLAAGSAGCDEAQRAVRPNVLLITLDTTRADRLGAYGYPAGTTPHLDRLAASSVLHLNAVSTSSWTLPSHASMLTGKYPISHGARFDPKGPLILSDGIGSPESWRAYRARGLAEDEVTLAQLLRAGGYRTGAVVAGPWMKRVFGLDAGFEIYDDSLVSSVEGGLAEDVTDRALEFVRAAGDEPFFLFLNYYDPHGPYGPPWSFQLRLGPKFWGAPRGEKSDTLSRYYDAEIRYLDRHLGRLLNVLRGRELFDDSLIIVTADHGELLGEHGKYGHGVDLTQEELHVPLIVKYPSSQRAGETSAARVSNTAVFGVILEQAGLEVPAQTQAHIPPNENGRVVAETYPLPALSDGGSWRALFEEEFKLVWNSKRGYRLHDLRADPSEQVDFTASQPERARRMRRALEEFLAGAPKPGQAGAAKQVDAETRRALESLGYLD